MGKEKVSSHRKESLRILPLAWKLGLADARREEIGGVPVCCFGLTRE